ncbi:hypothetical protein [Flammeovirga sp. SJP92]|uniref:DUF7000 family protein n=1 Tax=Flammeovirga sp. SJP92 TaxID=1775430 RepID=UPI000788DE39|nr:hypothetical protein [Flammeovirga sp. SJP92]KXX66624.1 hypothetical protein AVL50_31510 [Flammeovirga sp. SJP92]
MEDLNKIISAYKEQLHQGDIVLAYNTLIKLMMKVRTSCIKNLSEQYSFAGIFRDYLDYTYFYYSNDFLKGKRLKLGLVLNHMEMRFEIWFLGNTKPIQKEYWELLKTSKWNAGKTEMPQYAIIETVIVQNPDFNNLQKLAKEIETQMVKVSEELLKDLNEIN